MTSFKILRETVLRERQAQADAATVLAQELVTDTAEVIGRGPDALDNLDAWLAQSHD